MHPDRRGHDAEGAWQVEAARDPESHEPAGLSSDGRRDGGRIAQPPRRIGIVLPPGEGFGPAAVGAVGLLVQCLNAVPAPRWAPSVFGSPLTGDPFAAPRFRSVRLPGLPLLGRTVRYTIGLRRALRAYDPALIEVHNRPAIARALAAGFPTTPVILFLHNDPRTMRGARSPAQRRDLLRRLGAVAVVSDRVGRQMTEGCPEVDTPLPVTMPNYIDLAAVPPPAPAAARDRLILFVGRIVPEKGVHRFIEGFSAATARLPGWRAAILGAPHLREDRHTSAFERSVRHAAAAAGVTIEGYRPHGEVLAQMARAAIVVVPSLWEEPFGLTALEAMACGAALICSPRGNLRALTKGAALLVDPDDVAALADAMAALGDDVGQRAALGAAGVARAGGFGLADAAARLDALRRAVLGDGGAAS
ncbi:MAG: glycosyltransferase family 4 protein [Acetobacteraceae bacterium]